MRISVALAVVLFAAFAGAAWGQWSVSGVQVKPFLEVGAPTGVSTPDAFRAMDAEVDMRLSLNHGGQEFAAFALEPVVATEMSGRGRQMHFSNYYGVFNFGVGKPKLRIGQFIVPFGTLAEYDTHLMVLQTPYARTLGIRMDRGLELDALRAGMDLRLSVTSGDGRGRHDGGYAAVARAARDYERGNDTFRLGLSALHGKNMPVLETMPDPLPMGEESAPLEWVSKDRLAADLDWLHGRDNIRAELVAGWDDGRFVNGTWVLFNHPFSYKTDLTVQGDHWRQGSGSVVGVGAELRYRLDDVTDLRIAGEYRQGTTDEGTRHLSTLTVAWLRTFDLHF